MRSFLTLFFLLFGALLFGQLPVNEGPSLAEIVKMEMKRFSAGVKKSAESDVGQEYDWVFSECNWRIDPWVRNIDANVTHHINIVESTNSVSFDFTSNLDLDFIRWQGMNLDYNFESEYVLRIEFPEAVAGEQILEFQYSGDPTNPETSSFNQFIRTIDGSNFAEIYTVSQPFGARDWWPCKQDLSDKLDSIRINITVPTGNKAGSNGKLLGTEVPQSSWITYNWFHKYPIPAYLISLAVNNYEEFTQVAELENTTVEILNYVYPERLEMEQERAGAIPSMMQLFSELFGQYPYADEKYGHCITAIPGGMEHTTMSTQSGLFFDLTAHEMAHQWFGNTVTCGSYSDIWLNEGFATFLNGLAREHLSDYESYLSYWENARNFILTQPDGSVLVPDATNPTRIFDQRLSYLKGAYLLRMLRWNLGDEVFFEACRNYLNDPGLRFSFVSTSDFKSHLEAVSGEELSSFFDQWYRGEGYPKLGVQWANSASGVILKMTQTPSHPSVDFFELKVPVLLLGADRDSLFVVDHVLNGQRNILSPGFAVDEVIVDPEFKLLMDPTVVQNLNLQEEGEIIVFPNPAKDRLKVSILESEFGVNEYRIFNALGSLVSSFSGNELNENFTIRLDDLSSGIYVLELSGRKGRREVPFLVSDY